MGRIMEKTKFEKYLNNMLDEDDPCREYIHNIILLNKTISDLYNSNRYKYHDFNDIDIGFKCVLTIDVIGSDNKAYNHIVVLEDPITIDIIIYKIEYGFII